MATIKDTLKFQEKTQNNLKQQIEIEKHLKKTDKMLEPKTQNRSPRNLEMIIDND